MYVFHAFHKVDEPEEPTNESSIQLFNSLFFDLNGGKEVYAKLIEDEDENVTQISIVSDLMHDKDCRFFVLHEKDTVKSYRPYFCEFFVDNTVSVNQSMMKTLGANVGKWIKVHLFKENKDFLNSVIIEGTLVFSASPVVRARCYIVYNQEDIAQNVQYVELNTKDKTLDEPLLNIIRRGATTNNERIIEEFRALSTNVDCINGRVYNVGQGNCISLELNGENGLCTMFFDVGEALMPSKEADEFYYIGVTNNSISSIEPNFVLLSHWDSDHILGVHALADCAFRLNNDNGHQTFWITPDLNLLNKCQRSASAARLCAYLVQTGIIYMCNQLGERINNSCNDCVELFQGRGSNTKNQRTNNIGLILKIKTRSTIGKNTMEQSLLLTGDCEYCQMHNEVLGENKYDLIVTPHHGSKYAVLVDSKDEIGYCCVNASSHGRAIISYGKNKHGHPEAAHIAALKRSGFTYYMTPGCERIDFSASTTNRLEIKTIKGEIS